VVSESKQGGGLKIRLKPDEMIFIGSAVIQNSSDGAATLIVKNKVPILRHKDILKEEQADTPAKQLYFAIQLAYMFGMDERHLRLISDRIALVGRLYPDRLVDAVDAGIAVNDGDCYRALKIARQIVAFEADLMAGSAPGS